MCLVLMEFPSGFLTTTASVNKENKEYISINLPMQPRVTFTSYIVFCTCELFSFWSFCLFLVRCIDISLVALLSMTFAFYVFIVDKVLVLKIELSESVSK